MSSFNKWNVTACNSQLEDKALITELMVLVIMGLLRILIS